MDKCRSKDENKHAHGALCIQKGDLEGAERNFRLLVSQTTVLYHLFIHYVLLHDEVRFCLLLVKGNSRICSDLQSKFINIFGDSFCKAWHKNRSFPDSRKDFWSHFISVNRAAGTKMSRKGLEKSQIWFSCASSRDQLINTGKRSCNSNEFKGGWEEKQIGKKENKELWFCSTKRLALVLAREKLAFPAWISVSN